MSQVKIIQLCSLSLAALVLLCISFACGSKVSSDEEDDSETLHLSFSLHASTMLLGVTDALVSELTLQRFNCPTDPEPIDYGLNLVQADKVFVLNERRDVLEGCSLRVRNVKLNWKELTVVFTSIKDSSTSSGTIETVLANSSKTAFLNVVIPSKVGEAVDKNLFWPMVMSYVDSKSRLFPVVVEARETGVASLGLSISRLEDRGVVNSIWREFGVSLSCGGPQTLGTCNGSDLMGLTARLVLQSDVDTSVAEQIRYQGGIDQLLFKAGLTHLVGSGLRFTLNAPISYFGQRMYLILMKGQRYTVFEVAPELVPTANQ